MPRSRVDAPVALAVVFFAVAVVAAFVVHTGPGALVGRDAVDAFLSAWRASRAGTYVMETSFERVAPNGATLRSPGLVVQRPPDRLVVQFGGVDGVLDGHIIRCDTDPTGRYRCTEGPPAEPFAAAIDRELATLASYFAPAKPLYTVTGDGHGCFRLLLRLDFPSPPYGTSAQFCFDRRTGARTFTQVIRREATEITRATAIRAQVHDADLRVPDAPPGESTTPATGG